MLDRAEEKAMVQFLSKFDEHPFVIRFADHEYLVGEGEPAFVVDFKKAIPVSALLTSTSIALGEAYMNGDLDIEGDLYGALDHFLGQMGSFSADQNALKKLIYTSVSKKNQEQEVSSHYDIGNDFYKLWLDDTLSYSCAYFKHSNDTLEQAQKNKVSYILEKLYLEEGMDLLDIGCGWGFLLSEAAKKYKVHGMGITLSRRQYTEFKDRIEKEELEDYLTVELMDYRDIPKYGRKFDRIVSVGMVEHVGRENYPLFISRAEEVLRDGGIFLLHFISALKEHPGDAWIKKYIFPGGVVPSLREMIAAFSDYNFHILDVENLRSHYNRTLLCWSENYREHMDEVREMFNERFARMWNLYLSACAATFHNGIIDLHQILATKGVNNSLPDVRWY